MNVLSTNACTGNARRAGTAIPAFNIPLLAMREAVVEALEIIEAYGELFPLLKGFLAKLERRTA